MNECKVDVQGSSVIGLGKQKLGRTFNFDKIFKTHHVHSQSQKKLFGAANFLKLSDLVTIHKFLMNNIIFWSKHIIINF